MYEVMNACVIMHTMIIESELTNSVHDDPYDWEGSLAQDDHKVPVEFETFLQRHCEICDEHVHQQVRHDLVAHLWARRGDAA
jgi:hypothetical protein